LTETEALAEQDNEPRATPAATRASLSATTIPWLDGTLLRYLSSGLVLDIKAPNDLDKGPVVPGAVITFLPRLARQPAAPSRKAGSFDAVFSRDALCYVDDRAAILAGWFDLVRPDGYLVLILPQAAIPSFSPSAPGPSPMRYPAAASWRPSAGATTLLGQITAALPAEGFEIVHFTSAPARRHDEDGRKSATDLRVVLRKLVPPDQASGLLSEALPAPSTLPAAADVSIPFTHINPHPLKAPGMRAEHGLLIRDFAPALRKVARILVLKLDHHGDFIIGLPALRELRQAFPDAYIRLVCGSWNAASARACGVADDVRIFDYFPERAAEWTGSSASPGWGRFTAATEGRFDIAIDLRVDEDTRALLGRIDAGCRAGIGSIARFPLLDIALPDGSREPAQLPLSAVGNFSTSLAGTQILLPEAFDSTMDIRTPLQHESAFASPHQLLLRSAMFVLPQGRYAAEFHLTAQRFVPGLRGVGVKLEIVADGDRIIASKVFGRRSIARLDAQRATLVFDSAGKPGACGFRVRTEGRPLSGRLRFSGLRLRRLDANGARYAPSELHVGEKLSLLVCLVRARTQALASPAPEPPARSAGAKNFVIAPFSNSTVRDWPAAHYAALITLLAKAFDCRIEVVGAPAQTAQAAALMALVPKDLNAGRVTNQVGKTSWAGLPSILRGADLVICNNSGIAHQASQLGARTLAIYSASHQPTEWGPRGPSSRAIMMSVACSPCGYERIQDCVADHLCMRMITPAAVLGQVSEMLVQP